MNTDYFFSRSFIIILLLYLCNGLSYVSINAFGLDPDINNNMSNSQDILDKFNAAELFDFGSGIFAGILSALSFLAYLNLKIKKLLIVSLAFALFSIHEIFLHLDIFNIEIESSILELMLSIITFISLALFFIALVKRERKERRKIA